MAPRQGPESAGGHDRVALGVRWRGFQRAAIERLAEAMERGDRRLQLVAPPGAGKTLMGLEIALRTGRPIVCLSNTVAIQRQWQERLVTFALGVQGGPPVREQVRLAMVAPGQPLPLMQSLTYQAFTLQRSAAQRRGVAGVRGRLTEAVAAFHDRAGEAGAVLVLDECHHLRRWWAEVLVDFLGRFPETQVIGLTATPPSDATAEERRRFRGIVTEVTHEIPLVAAVREGLLCPYRDLVRFVRPTEAEERFVLGCEARLSAWLEEARDGAGAGQAWIPGLRAHALSRCADPGRRERTWSDFLAMLDADPDWAIALVRYLQSVDVDMPPEVFPMEEMAFPPARADIMALLDDYVVSVLRPSTAPEAARRLASLKEALRGTGATLRRDGVRDGGALYEEALGRSRAKLGAALEILEREWAVRGEDLCAAVITDFERTAAGGRRHDGLGHGDVAGAVGAFRAVAARPGLEGLMPVLATGAMRWMPEALVEPLRTKLGAMGARLHASALAPEVVGAPGSWVSVELPDGRGALLAAMTRLLERDESHCIVGTRALLGEGWDCRVLDTLVDLTASRTNVAVNQLRGRVLRLDPDRPEKVSHIWDVVAVGQGVGGAAARADFERFEAKHHRFWAPAADGALEKGPGHVHPRLRGARPPGGEALEAVQAELWAEVPDRGKVRERWRLGEPLAERELASVRVAMPPEAAPRRAPTLHSEAVPALAPDRYALRWRGFRRWLGVRVGLGAAGLAVLGGAPLALGLAAAAPAMAASLAGLGVLAAWQALAAARLRRTRALAAPQDFAERVLRVLGEALREAAPQIRAVQVRELCAGDGGLSYALEGGSALSRRRVAEAFDQALRGCPAPHYALEVHRMADLPARWWAQLGGRARSPWATAGFVPVPAALGISRRVATAWAEAWGRHIGPCTLVAVRRRRETGELPWRDPKTMRWLAATGARGETRALLM